MATLHVILAPSKNYLLDLGDTETIGDLKPQLSQLTSIPEQELKIIIGGEIAKDKTKLISLDFDYFNDPIYLENPSFLRVDQSVIPPAPCKPSRQWCDTHLIGNGSLLQILDILFGLFMSFEVSDRAEKTKILIQHLGKKTRIAIIIKQLRFVRNQHEHGKQLTTTQIQECIRYLQYYFVFNTVYTAKYVHVTNYH